MVVDERGQKQETKVWRLEVRFCWERVVARVWAFAMGLAKTADVEWRLVVCKSGLMSWNEITGESWFRSRRVEIRTPFRRVFSSSSSSKAKTDSLRIIAL